MAVLKDNDDYWLMIVDGFIREENRLLLLSIPQDINKVILIFYKNDARYFDKYNKELFKTENDNKTIIPASIALIGWHGYLIYPSPNGCRTGIHKWAVKFARDLKYGRFARRSVGVTNKIETKWIYVDLGRSAWPSHDDHSQCYSFCDGSGKDWHWQEQETIEMVLDLNAFSMTYYRIIGSNESQEITKIKEDKLAPNQTYFFALCIDSDQMCGEFECVLPITE